jgi:hypothetical protein
MVAAGEPSSTLSSMIAVNVELDHPPTASSTRPLARRPERMGTGEAGEIRFPAGKVSTVDPRDVELVASAAPSSRLTATIDENVELAALGRVTGPPERGVPGRVGRGVAFAG